jgi:hypothetical protein
MVKVNFRSFPALNFYIQNTAHNIKELYLYNIYNKILHAYTL